MTTALKYLQTKLPLVFIIVMCGCLDPYAPPVADGKLDILVVDGFMDQQSAQVRLTKAVPLATEDGLYPVESGAVVTIEAESGARYSVPEISPGNYSRTNVGFPSGERYRLHITTPTREEYFSQYIELKSSPSLDSVTWRPFEDGVAIYVHAHDETGNTRYYQWTYEETWEYRSKLHSAVRFTDKGEVLLRTAEEDIHTCWNSQQSSQILITSTEKFSEDRVQGFEIAFHTRGSRKLSRRYSINVQQRALTREAYEYWQELKKNTENLGTLFDPMPSQLTGNLYSSTNSEKPVLGFFSGGSIQEKRIFIAFAELPDYLLYNPPSFCPLDSIPLADISKYTSTTLLVSAYGSAAIEGYLSSTPNCIDCRLEGGNKNKPSFW